MVLIIDFLGFDDNRMFNSIVHDAVSGLRFAILAHSCVSRAILLQRESIRT